MDEVDSVQSLPSVDRSVGSLLTSWQIPAGPRARGRYGKLTTDKPQTGLPYLWSDGVPLGPPQSARFRVEQAIKRAVDVVLALSALIVLSPFLIAIVIAIRATSPGAALFRQPRTGRFGRTFGIYKFRTMHEAHCDPAGISQAQPGDDRVTALGRWLRSRSIDELPQLINVLTGEMSLVGPRPHVTGMKAGGVAYEALVPYYHLRYAVRPGITGWAQANGFRGPTDNAALSVARIDHDLAYIQNLSVWLDLKTLVLTAWREASRGTGV